MTGSETTALREIASNLALAGLRAVTPESLLRNSLRLSGESLHGSFLDDGHRFELALGGKLIMVAVGKAAAPLAAELHRLLGDRIDRGLVVTKEGFALPGLPFPQLECGHPVPDARGIAAAGEVESLVGGLSTDDVVLVLVSGGASALLPAPVPGISLSDKQALSGRMLRAHMDIHEINIVRKALSRLKGGGLSHLAAPAQVVGLYLSDVPGDDMGSIGSGLTVPQPVEREAAASLLREHGLWADAPLSIRETLDRPDSDPQSDGFPPLVAQPINGVIGANRHLLRAIGDAAEHAGFRIQIDETPVTGPVDEAMRRLLKRWAQVRNSAHAGPDAPATLICGGEITVNVTGNGLGGRCQELAARMMPYLDGRTVFLAAGSDGNDGPTDAAGGVVDRGSWIGLREGNILYDELMADNDSNRLLRESGNLLRFAPTRNNLMDMYLFFETGNRQPGEDHSSDLAEK